MSDVAFLMIAISFLMVAFLTAVATLNASPKFSRIANTVIYGSCVAAMPMLPAHLLTINR
jgi:hypothetical protein